MQPAAPSLRLVHALLAFALVGLFAASCTGTLGVRLEQPPTPDRDTIGTLAALMLTGTHAAAVATQRAAIATPEPPIGQVSGELCYPSQRVPGMTVHFRNMVTDDLTSITTSEGQMTYTVSLEPGTYVGYAWVADYQLGGLYSRAVPCGLTEECTDHSPLPFDVAAGDTLSGIDLCDWGLPVENLPVPPVSTLPGRSTAPFPADAVNDLARQLETGS